MRFNLKVYDQPPAKQPSQAEVSEAVEIHKQGDLEKAVKLYRKLTKKYPRNPQLAFLQEIIEIQQDGWQDDIPLVNDILVGNKGLAAANRVFGGYLLGLKRSKEAERFLLRAESDFRRDPLYLYHMGAALADQEKFETAEVWLQQALLLNADFPSTYFELGNIYQKTERLEKAVACYQKAIELDPEFFGAFSNLGGTFLRMMRLKEAMACFDRCMELNWDDKSIKGRAAITMMAMGILPDAWKLYEYAMPAGDRTKHGPLELPKPRWNDQDLTDKGILIWPEQGIGDNLRFSSCLPDLIERAGHVIVITAKRLAPLFARSFPKARVIASDEETVEMDSFEYHLPIGSLPLYFRQTQKDFPNRQRYLTPAPEAVEHWRQRLAELGDGLKIGVCWESQLQTADNRQHFCTLDKWEPVFKAPGATFINLQYNLTPETLAKENAKYDTDIIGLEIDLYNDLDGVAALEEALDLVITVGTCMSDFAGSVGTECWTLLLDWCPDLLGTDRLLWYPNTRVFTRHWDEPWEVLLQRVANALEEKLTPQKTAFQAPASRNAPCPCGSGKRYKHCCGAAS